MNVTIKAGETWHLQEEGVYFLHNYMQGGTLEIVGPPNSLLYLELPPCSSLYMLINPSFTFSAKEKDVFLIYEKAKDTISGGDSGDSEEDTGDNLMSNLLSGKTFVVDAGHGGHDPGAVNSNLGLHEADIALIIADKLADLLISVGATVIMTRLDNTFVGLSNRAKVANTNNADAFISIHLNSADNSKATGYEVLTYSDKGKAAELAKLILANLTVLPWPNRGLKARTDLTVLKKTAMPAVLVECGFINNDEEAKMLNTSSTQQVIADAIFDAVADYYAQG